MFDRYVIHDRSVNLVSHVKYAYMDRKALDREAWMAGVRQFDEDQVMRDVLEVFWHKGFAATSMQELAAATGVQRGSLYNAYGGKEALFLQAYHRYQERYLDGVRHALAPADIRAALTGFFDYSISMIRTNRRGCLTTKTATDEGADSPRIRDTLRRLTDALEACLRERLSRSADALRIPPDAAARLLVTFTRGVVVVERLYDDPDRLQADARALIDMLVR